MQQKFGIAITAFCIIKSLFVIINMVIYLVHFFKDNEDLQINYDTVSNQIFVSYLPDVYLFPQLAPNNVPGLSTFLGAILAILFGLMTIFETISIYSAVWMIKRTLMLMQKIEYIQIPTSSENENNNGLESVGQLQEQQINQEQLSSSALPPVPENNA